MVDDSVCEFVQRQVAFTVCQLVQLYELSKKCLKLNLYELRHVGNGVIMPTELTRGGSGR